MSKKLRNACSSLSRAGMSSVPPWFLVSSEEGNVQK